MKTQSSVAAPNTTINGIDLAALQGCIDTVRASPGEGKTNWRVRSTWKGGTRADHQVSECSIGGRTLPRDFTIRSDEPLELCGTNRHPNPQELLLSSLNACMMVGYAAVAALMGITLTKLEVEVNGDIDLRGFLGIDSNVAAGYRGLTQVVRISGDATEAQFAQLHEAVRATSPNLYNITRAIPTESRLVVEGVGEGK